MAPMATTSHIADRNVEPESKDDKEGEPDDQDGVLGNYHHIHPPKLTITVRN